MAVPATTTVFAEVLDPNETLDFIIDVTGLLETGETVSSFTLVPMSEASILGLTILNSGGYSSGLISGNRIRFWANISIGMRGDPSFDDAGVTLPVEVTIVTNSVPPRTKQRTVGIKVAHR